jgi:hypothetical protein
MDRVVRISGVVVVAAFALWAYLVFDHAVRVESPTPTVAADVAGSGVGTDPDGAVVPTDPVDGDDEPPRALAFRPDFGSRIYAVADLPDSADRDASPADDGDAYPLETDLVPHASLAGIVALEPGLYATAFDGQDCSYELVRYDRQGEERIIGQDRLSEGRMLVSLNEIEPDVFVPSPQCGGWSLWSPLVEPLVTAEPGDYWVGDLTLGLWEVPEGCLWEEVVDFRGARLSDVVESGRGPQRITIDDDTLGIRFRGCDHPLVLVEAGVDPRPAPLRSDDR